VTLADGRTIDLESVLGPAEGRKKLVIVGDTEATDGLVASVRGADVLVIEATFLERDAAIARDYGHLPAQSWNPVSDASYDETQGLSDIACAARRTRRAKTLQGYEGGKAGARPRKGPGSGIHRRSDEALTLIAGARR
jgi:hypothetical protein